MNKLDKNMEALILCIFEVVVGVLLLINPIGFTAAIIVGTGAVLVVLGIVDIVGYFRMNPDEAAKKNGLSKGLTFVIVGLFCMIKPKWFITTFPLFTVFYGVIILLSGIGKIQWSVDMLRKNQKYWYVAMIGAVLSLLFAILILTDPFASTAVLWTFIAISLIIAAVVDILAFIFGRK